MTNRSGYTTPPHCFCAYLVFTHRSRPMKGSLNKVFNWERWSYDMIYAPVSVCWAYYALRARSFWFFTPVNPTLKFVGFEGGSKWEMYQQLPKRILPLTLFGDHQLPFADVLTQVKQAGLDFPFVVKPDSDMQGAMFVVVRNESELRSYHEAIGKTYILQAFIQYPHEFSVFYIRYPGDTKGMITGLVAKDFLHVVGDGDQTLGQLSAGHPLAKYNLEELRSIHAEMWDRVLESGTTYILNHAGNHRHGAKFINLHNEIDATLHAVFDQIGQEANQLYFGRYDLKCSSLEDLKAGKNIQVLENNGASAVTIHMFDCGMSYFQALKKIVRHWGHLYRIGRINNKSGVRYWSFWEGYRFMQQTKRNFERLLCIEKNYHRHKGKNQS